jgi:hypothetical protein
MLLVAVDADERPPLRHGVCELLEYLLGICPVDASISDGDAVLET